MTFHLPLHNEQIVALLTGKALSLVQRYAGRERLQGHEYASLITVTRADVHSYVETHGVPRGAWSHLPSSRDGLYMVQLGDEFHIYLQERGTKFDGGNGSIFKSKSLAEAALTDYLLAMSGCGLFPLPEIDSPARRLKQSWRYKRGCLTKVIAIAFTSRRG